MEKYPHQKKSSIIFADGITEKDLIGILKEIIKMIDRESIFKDSRLEKTLKEPLIIERIGKEKAISLEIHNLILNIIDETYYHKMPGSSYVILSSANYRYSNHNLFFCIESLRKFIVQLKELNNEDESLYKYLAELLRKQFTLPTYSQQAMLYTFVQALQSGLPVEDLLKKLNEEEPTLEEEKKSASPEIVQIITEIQTEIIFLKDWCTKNINK